MLNRFWMLSIVSGRCGSTKNSSGVPSLRFTNGGFAAWRKVDTTISTTIAFTLGAAHRTGTRCGRALTDIGLENGPLVICLGSDRHDQLKSTYGATDMDRDLTEAVFSTDPREMVEKFGFTLATGAFPTGRRYYFWALHDAQ